MTPARREAAERAGLTLAMALAEAMRAGGAAVPTDRVMTLVQAWAGIDCAHGEAVYWSARLVLADRPEAIAVFDAAFAMVVRGQAGAALGAAGEAEPPPGAAGAEARPEAAATAAGRPQGSGGWRASARATDRAAVLAPLDARERAALGLLADAIAEARPAERRRRLARASRGPAVDARRLFRWLAADPPGALEVPRRRPRVAPRKLALLLDVSGSMRRECRLALLLGLAAARAGGRIEVHAIGTRATRLTRALRGRDLDRAVAAAAARLRDFQGGTRLGDSLRTLLADPRSATFLRGALTLFYSDGLERGDPGRLAAAAARLGRLSRAVLWLTPLGRDAGGADRGAAVLAARFATAAPVGSAAEAAAALGAFGRAPRQRGSAETATRR